jgi:hypothetical protein
MSEKFASPFCVANARLLLPFWMIVQVLFVNEPLLQAFWLLVLVDVMLFWF